MPSPKDSIVEAALRKLAHVVYHYPRLIFYPTVILFVTCVVYTVSHLQFNTNRNALVGADKKYHRNFLEFEREFQSQDDIVAVIESDDMEKNRQFVERLAAKLEAEPNLFTNVFYKGDLKQMGPKALLFLPEATLVELRQTLRDYRPFIQNFSHATNLYSLFRLVNKQFLSASLKPEAETESMIKAIPALERIIRQAADCLNRPGMPPSPGITALFGGGDEAEQGQYITYDHGHIYLVTMHAVDDDSEFDTVERLRALVRATQREVPGVNVGITGEPVLEYDEMSQAQWDTTLATIVSLILVAVIFIYAYSETGRPIKATVCLITGIGFTMGFTTVAVGHLNILSITFAPMLIGLAIDFGVHLITRYEEELRRGRNERQALDKAMVFTGMGIFTSGFTTAGAFLAMSLTDFKGVQEMGLIAGGGLLICLVPMTTLLPVLILRGRQNVLDHQLGPQVETRERIEQLWLQRPVLVSLLSVVLTALALTQFPKVYFDYNLLHMQSKGLPAVELGRKLMDSASRSVLFCAVIADSLDEAVALEQRLTNLTTVGSVESMARFLSEDQDRELELVQKIKQDLAGLAFAPIDLEPVNVTELSGGPLWSLQGYLGSAVIEVQKEKDVKLEKELRSMWGAIQRLRTRMLSGDRNQNGVKLATFQQALFNDLRTTFAALQNQEANERLRAEDLPATLRNRFVGKTGKLLLQVFPKEDVWQREHQEAFVRELRQTLDPHDSNKPIITGTPVQLFEYTTLLKESYQEAAWYSLWAIVILVLVHFRSIACLILALLPVAAGTIWMVGLMGWLGIPFNPANIMTLPLVIGIGVTSGIHILNRFAEEQTPSILAKSTGKAVIVSGLTTVVGFGSLVLAKHQGIQSLGYVMSIGTSTCMLAALTFLPAILNLLNRWGWTIKKPSGSNALPPPGREEPR